jgi:hypothetical protein
MTPGPLSGPDASGLRSASAREEGQVRDCCEPLSALAALRLSCAQFELTSIDVICAEDDLACVAAGRRT